VDIGRKLQNLDNRLTRVERSPRLAHAAIDDTSVEVRDSAGGLRGLLGMQADGTTAVNVVNGPPPPQPSAPIVASVLGGVTVSWDGLFADGSVLPLDWARVEVHASIVTPYDPMSATLQGTIETAQGATVVVPCDTAVYVRLLARNTSGTASTASAIVGPYGPTPVVADDILDGIVTETKLAAGAVTEAKIAANAVGTVALQDGAVLTENLAEAAVAVGKLADNAVTGAAIASEAVSTAKLAANAVTADKILAGAVTAAKVAAGAITTEKLTVTGGANLLSDPSYEGAYTAALVSGSASWTQDATGNGSAKSLKVNAVAGSPTSRSMKITTVPILPADQLYIATDYLTSSDYTATAAVKMYARWEDSAGAVLSYGVAQASPPTIGGSTWSRITNTVTAPANTVQATIWVESYQAQAGSVWFDNSVVRPVLAGTQIQDGAITTTKIVAASILAGQIAAGAVLTDKLAAEAVTAAKIAALTITGDKIAANAITVGKLAAGAVDATAIAADAITGKAISGGTITGALIQTDTSGERIVLNEDDENKIEVYDATRVVAELSALGLGLLGSSGAAMVLDPNATYPNITLTNADQTNQAVINVSDGTAGAADLGLNSGKFTVSSLDWKWRTYFGNDFWVAERIRDGASTTNTGGRVILSATNAAIGYQDTTDSANDTSWFLTEGFAHLYKGRMAVTVPPSSSSGLLVNAETGHTGLLQRLQLNGVDKFLVDKDGNATVAGNLTVSGIGQRQTKRRTSDATKTSNTTIAADTQITFPVDANGVYMLDGLLKYSGPGDFQMGWTFPSGTLGEWQGIGNGTTVIGYASGAIQTDTSGTFGYMVRTETSDITISRTYGGISTSVFGVQVRALFRVGGTAGNIALAWAQGTSNATATTLYTDSHLRLEKVA
jgi:hypothetical protein